MQQPRPLTDLLGGLVQDLSDLVRQQLLLARVETVEKIRGLVPPLAVLVLGGMVASLGLLFMLRSLVLGLERAGMPPWSASLLVGVVVTTVGTTTLAIAARRLRSTELTPRKSSVEVQRDIRVLKEPLK